VRKAAACPHRLVLPGEVRWKRGRGGKEREGRSKDWLRIIDADESRYFLCVRREEKGRGLSGEAAEKDGWREGGGEGVR
jgi:hypothetical protein